jgi:hypothetical protein
VQTNLRVGLACRPNSYMIALSPEDLERIRREIETFDDIDAVHDEIKASSLATGITCCLSFRRDTNESRREAVCWRRRRSHETTRESSCRLCRGDNCRRGIHRLVGRTAGAVELGPRLRYRVVAIDGITEAQTAMSRPVSTGVAASADAFWRRSAMSSSCG